ncbi:MAG TPA: hypothetical protein VNL94_06235 [Candidatus Binatia bacterium]|nr:hypothetical protein [Candidatus Binatia bacterium]
MNVDRVSRGAWAALVAAIAGGVALVTIALFFTVGGPFGTINDAVLIALVLALPSVMLAHDELGGVVPLWPARLSLAGGIAAALGWAILHGAFIVRIVDFDDARPATGAFVVSNLLQAGVGLWIAGASLLAGSWLPTLVRVLGIVAGLGTVLLSVGLLLGGMSHPLTIAGGPGYQLVLPVWAYLLSRVFRARADAARTSTATTEGAPALSTT